MAEPLFSPRRAIPLEGIATKAASEPDRLRELARKEIEHLQNCAAKVLASPEGRELFEHLIDITYRAMGPNPFSEDYTAEKFAAAAAALHGQKQIVRHVLALAARAEGEAGFPLKSPLTTGA